MARDRKDTYLVILEGVNYFAIAQCLGSAEIANPLLCLFTSVIFFNIEQRASNYGAKVGTTAIIWAFATAMLAISIPLVSITNSGVILPLAIVFGVTLCTNMIWRHES